MMMDFCREIIMLFMKSALFALTLGIHANLYSHPGTKGGRRMGDGNNCTSESSIYGQWPETTLIRLDRCLPELIAFVLGGSDLGELRRSRAIVHIYYSSMHSPADYI